MGLTYNEDSCVSQSCGSWIGKAVDIMKRLVAVLMAVVLAVGLCPGLAIAGDGLVAGGAAQRPGDEAASVDTQLVKGFVAGRVYALIGNKYAMMITEKKKEQTVNIINSNYKSMLKLTSTSKYRYSGLTKNGVDVYDQDTMKHGLFSFAGKQMTPCSYDSLRENETGSYILGRTENDDGTGTLTVLSGKTGKKLASVNVGKADARFFANWVYGTNKINVERGARTDSDANYYDEVYSFKGNKLKRVSSKQQSSSNDYVIAPKIVQRYESDGYKYYTSKGKSGKLIKSLVGWHYQYAAVNNTYLFASDDGMSAKFVDGKAKTVRTITASSAQSYWSIVGEYVYSSAGSGNDAVRTFYSAKGKKVLTLPKGQNLRALYTGAAAKYYSYKEATARNLDGGEVTVYRPLKYYDEKLKAVKGKKYALGMYLLSVKSQAVYDSGRNAAGDYYMYLYSGFKQGSPDVVTAEGKAVKCGKYTLTHPIRGAYYHFSRCDLQVGAKDAYIAKNSAGKYGVVSSSGKVKVPFKYDDIFCGTSGSLTLPSSNKVMVKKSGKWSFVTVS